MTKKKILVFTDSRGQHKAAGKTHDIFAERLAKDSRFECDIYLCPMKWTTTLDFFNSFTDAELAAYDHVILYTGIVEWSPRPAKSAWKDLYDNPTSTNAENLGLNTRDYSKKIVNNKKKFFDATFGAKEIKAYLKTPFEQEYEGEKTINMYGLEMGAKHLLPRLKKMDNLIFITANRFVKGWEGDFKRTRPLNIDITHAYSDMFAKGLAGKKLVDLRAWSDDQIKNYTCDNIHLTKEGSDYIYSKLLEHMDVTEKASTQNLSITVPDYSFEGFKSVERILGAKKEAIMKRSKNPNSNYLATLVIGVRINADKPDRQDNLKFLLRWIDFHYGDLFDVLLIEQDEKPRIDLADLGAKPYVRHEFIYNPEAYNRGWGYNVAVQHFCRDSLVVALLDTDVLVGANFLSDVLACQEQMDAVSPYMNIYYTDKKEAQELQKTMQLNSLKDTAKIKNPVTVAGGVVIFNRASYLAIKGFEQYVGYACEDRALDVTIFNHLDPSRIRISPATYVHLYHDNDAAARSRFDEIYAHLIENYNCKYCATLTPYDFIHTNCQHASKKETQKLMMLRAEDFGDINLYRSGDSLTVNGQRVREPIPDEIDGVVFPPDFKGLDGYAKREVYANTPAASKDELAMFHNAYKGKRCFIIGNGPSLNKHDLSLLDNEYTFGVNSFYYKTRETGFQPFFYVVEDSSVMKENLAEIKAYNPPFKFFPTIYKRLHPEAPNTFFFDMNRGFYERTSPNYAVPRFSTDATDVLYCGQSVTYINLQLAFFMGFTEVYLIGMDFDYIIPDSHQRTGDVLLSDTDDMNHFHKDYFGKGKTWKDPKLERVLMNYKMADLAFSAVGRKIYNATVGGKLEEFDRVDYYSLFDGNEQNAAATQAHSSSEISLSDADNNFVQFYHLGAKGNQIELQKSDVAKALKASQDCGLMLYTDPRQLLAKALISNGNAEAQLENWVEELNDCMEIYRKNRTKLAVVERTALTSNLAAYDETLNKQGVKLSDYKVAPALESDPILCVLADAIFAKNNRAQKILSELQASSLTPEDISVAAMPPVAKALGRYRAMIKNSQDLAGKVESIQQAKLGKEQEIATLNSVAETEKSAAHQLKANIERMRLKHDMLSKENAQNSKTLTDERDELRRDLDYVYGSKSWRVTKLLRSVRSTFGPK